MILNNIATIDSFIQSFTTTTKITTNKKSIIIYCRCFI